MRRLAVLPILALLSTAATAEPACTERAASYDTRELDCRFPSAEPSRRYELRAYFSGGHDDTQASLQAEPTACEEGSKTSLMGEDGDIWLSCRVTVAPTASGEVAIRLLVRWSHAQYERFGLQPLAPAGH